MAGTPMWKQNSHQKCKETMQNPWPICDHTTLNVTTSYTILKICNIRWSEGAMKLVASTVSIQYSGAVRWSHCSIHNTAAWARVCGPERSVVVYATTLHRGLYWEHGKCTDCTISSKLGLWLHAPYCSSRIDGFLHSLLCRITHC